MRREDFKLDFDDKRTSFIERVLVYVSITCVILTTIFEFIQAYAVLVR